MTDAFLTGVHLGRSLNLDPLQLSEARRLCWNQIRRSDERRRLKPLPPNPVSIHLLWNLTSFVVLIRLRIKSEKKKHRQKKERQRLCFDSLKVINTSQNF